MITSVHLILKVEKLLMRQELVVERIKKLNWKNVYIGFEDKRQQHTPHSQHIIFVEAFLMKAVTVPLCPVTISCLNLFS